MRRDVSETAVAKKGHVHRWRVMSFEHLNQVVGYRCDCGEKRSERGEEAASVSRNPRQVERRLRAKSQHVKT